MGLSLGYFKYRVVIIIKKMGKKMSKKFRNYRRKLRSYRRKLNRLIGLGKRKRKLRRKLGF